MDLPNGLGRIVGKTVRDVEPGRADGIQVTQSDTGCHMQTTWIEGSEPVGLHVSRIHEQGHTHPRHQPGTDFDASFQIAQPAQR